MSHACGTAQSCHSAQTRELVSVRICIYIYIYIHICTALMRPRRPKQYCLQLDIALWCKTQMEHSIWDEYSLFCNCACSLAYSSLSTLAGLSYHICGKLEVAFKASPSSQHQHCTDEAQKAETVQLIASRPFG